MKINPTKMAANLHMQALIGLGPGTSFGPKLLLAYRPVGPEQQGSQNTPWPLQPKNAGAKQLGAGQEQPRITHSCPVCGHLGMLQHQAAVWVHTPSLGSQVGSGARAPRQRSPPGPGWVLSH
uniref:Uncharacterized protein n=1 Tax=Pipistrellus kuhlii TaxID=59472 RepID=A0A7J7YXC7_PIPKU|nr:hypothetical protein mPipKuh1_009891 [Pipistrellus kuhlii]